MICTNIIIITAQDPGPDEETAAALQMLRERYSNRTVIHFRFTIDATRTPEALTQSIAQIDPKDPTDRARDTGVYALFHGGGGIHFGEALTGRDLAARGKADQLVKVILECRKQGFHIRKICFLTCLGINTLDKTPVSVPDKVTPGQKNLFVQDVCQRFSQMAKDSRCSDLLNGIMVAGYATPVYLSDPAKTTDAGKMAGRRPGAKTWQNIKGTDTGNPQFAMHPAVDADKSLNKPRDFKSYKERKSVFICDGSGNWSLGSLWEYSDKAEWKEALGKPT